MQRKLVSLGRSDRNLNTPCSVDVSTVSSLPVPVILVFQRKVQSWGINLLLKGIILNTYSLF